MSKSLNERYRHYDASGVDERQALEPSSEQKRVIAFGEYVHYLTNEFSVAPTPPQEASPIEMEIAESAKIFIEEVTGLSVSCSLSMHQRLHNDLQGGYMLSHHHVAIKQVTAETNYGLQIKLGTAMAHEMAHSTGRDNSRIVDIQNGDSRNLVVLWPHDLSGVEPNLIGDTFFEEGFAEELASRWRIQFDPDLSQRERQIFALKNAPDLPMRMHASDQPVVNCIDGTIHVEYPTSGMSAFGIQLISEYTGVDIIDLLIQARKPETQRGASQLIRSTVD